MLEQIFLEIIIKLSFKSIRTDYVSINGANLIDLENFDNVRLQNATLSK